eukprot:gnl/TRDRNA2_/TRDRNA2_185076_c0_seq1.p1 gnl/TRDRNA2_/TRDRNA2_185076_c0~~gnl/TRDRNA2_/TRDRNA2_185076_c0_seq1.p1  ORF type:complete len:185 (+),score=46.24 gnl/TRDRNA2_/TRDRNA2_185076_c0_seq1:88-642(+)
MSGVHMYFRESRGPLPSGNEARKFLDHFVHERHVRKLRGPEVAANKAAAERHQQVRDKHAPGALAWLYVQPEADVQRAEAWMSSRPAKERNLRRVLRTPLSQLVPLDNGGNASVGDSQSSVNEISQRQAELELLLEEAQHIIRPDAPVIKAGRLRLSRIVPAATAATGETPGADPAAVAEDAPC